MSCWKSAPNVSSQGEAQDWKDSADMSEFSKEHFSITADACWGCQWQLKRSSSWILWWLENWGSLKLKAAYTWAGGTERWWTYFSAAEGWAPGSSHFSRHHCYFWQIAWVFGHWGSQRPALATAISTCHAATARMSASNLHLLTASDPSSLLTQSNWPQEDSMLRWWCVDDVCEAAYHCYTTTGNHTGNIYWFTQS